MVSKSQETISDNIRNFLQDLLNRGFDTAIKETNTESIGEIVNFFQEFLEKISKISSQNPTTKKTIFDIISSFFKEDKWQFEQLGIEPILLIPFQGKNGKWNCYAKSREEQQHFLFYSVCPIKVPDSKLQDIAEFIARANYNMIIGNFELDFTKGEVRYKTSSNIPIDNLSLELIRKLVYINVTIMDEYLPGIISIINGGISPEYAINQIEQNQEITTSADDFEQLVDVVSANAQKELALNTLFQPNLQQQETTPENEEHILTILTREEIGKFHEALQVLPRSRWRQADEIIARLKPQVITRLGEAGEEIFNQAYSFFSEVKIEIKNLKLIQRYSGLAQEAKLFLQSFSGKNELEENIFKLENLFWSINARLEELLTDNLAGMKELELLREIEEFRYELKQFEKLT